MINKNPQQTLALNLKTINPKKPATGTFFYLILNMGKTLFHESLRPHSPQPTLVTSRSICIVTKYVANFKGSMR